jgi:hypothetical protein
LRALEIGIGGICADNASACFVTAEQEEKLTWVTKMRPIVHTTDFSHTKQALFQSYVRNAENDEQGMTKEEFTNLMRLHGIEDDKFLESEGEIRLPFLLISQNQACKSFPRYLGRNAHTHTRTHTHINKLHFSSLFLPFSLPILSLIPPLSPSFPPSLFSLFPLHMLCLSYLLSDFKRAHPINPLKVQCRPTLPVPPVYPTHADLARRRCPPCL